MKKIPSLFVREFDRGKVTVTPVVTPGCEWVLAGEGVATVKIDGTACMVRDGVLFKRFDRRRAKESEPKNWEPCEESPDPVTGHWPGWVPVGDTPADRWHREAFDALNHPLPDGTYELIGPKIQGNPYRLTSHSFERHGYEIKSIMVDADPVVALDLIRQQLSSMAEEGIVWHHPDGRMCKVKRKDFGLDWPMGRNE